MIRILHTRSVCLVLCRTTIERNDGLSISLSPFFPVIDLTLSNHSSTYWIPVIVCRLCFVLKGSAKPLGLLHQTQKKIVDFFSFIPFFFIKKDMSITTYCNSFFVVVAISSSYHHHLFFGRVYANQYSIPSIKYQLRRPFFSSSFSLTSFSLTSHGGGSIKKLCRYNWRGRTTHTPNNTKWGKGGRVVWPVNERNTFFFFSFFD